MDLAPMRAGPAQPQSKNLAAVSHVRRTPKAHENVSRWGMVKQWCS